jgi:outer membrane protein assembly factor BamB
LMLSKATRPRLPRVLLLALLVLGILAGTGCSAAPSQGWSGPLVSDNVLYVGTLEGKILALDLTTADLEGGSPPQKKWEPKALVEVSGGGFCSRTNKPMGMYGTPAVWNGRVYVGAYDGNVLWVSIGGESVSDPEFDTGGPIVGGVVIDGDTLYVGNSDGKVYALDLNVSDLSVSLKEGWPFKTGGEIWSTPVVVDQVVYIASADHYLYAIDAESGNEIWRFETKAAIMSTPLLANGRIYIGGCDRKFYDIEAAREEERVAARDGAMPTTRQADRVFGGASNWFWTQALAYHGEIWVGSLDHNIYVLNAGTLELVTEIETGGMVYAPPVLFPTEGLVVVGSQDGKIYAINAETKDVSVYAIDAETEEVVASPEKPKNRLPPILAPLYADIVNGIVYFHSQDGTHTLYAFKLSTQEVLWSFRTDKIK